jgi:hypothetical protein
VIYAIQRFEFVCDWCSQRLIEDRRIPQDGSGPKDQLPIGWRLVSSDEDVICADCIEKYGA